MKFINKKISCMVLSMVLLVSVCTGCADKNIEFSYKDNYKTGSFNFTNDTGDLTALPFAAGLCVVGDTNTDNASLDMSQASSAVLFSINNNEVLYTKNAYERLQPASITKILTALVALKYGNLDDVITVTDNCKVTERGAQVLGFQAGDTLTLEQALNCLLIYSANDVALIIAEHISGSVDAFVQLMNEEAKKLGATNSNFVNPNGLSADNHYTTAYDLYLIFNEAIKNEKFKEIIHTKSYSTTYTTKDGTQKQISFNTTNQYLSESVPSPENIVVIGGKTGTTAAAGSCLILLSKDAAGNSYISVILKSTDHGTLYNQMTDLLQQINN